MNRKTFLSNSASQRRNLPGTGRLLLATAGVAVLAAGKANAFGSFGNNVDSFCAGLDGSTPYADQSCALCHNGTDYGQKTTAWDWYNNGQLEKFCNAPPAANTPPVLGAIGNHSVNQGEALSFTVSASDADGNAISLSASGLPAGASFDSASGQFSWTPNAQQSGNFPITFTATDDGIPAESASEQITVSVGIPNRPPVLAAIGPHNASVGSALSFTVSASDPDGDGLTLDAANLPTGASFSDNQDGTGSFSWTPQADQAGAHTVRFSVVDSGAPQGNDSEEVTLTVAGGNSAPVLAPIGNQTVQIGELLEITLSASDADGDALSIALDSLPNGANFTDNGDGSALFSWMPSADQAGAHPLNFSAQDDQSPAGSDSEAITVTVGGGNQPPVLAPIGNHTAYVGELIEIALSASDPNGDLMAFAIAPAGANLASSAALPTSAELIDNGDGTASLRWMPAADQLGKHAMQISVSDNGSPQASDAEEITLSVMQRDVVMSDLEIKKARWKARKNLLVVKGKGSAAGVMVDVYDADTNQLLGSAEANGKGKWRLRVQLDGLAPCSVRVSDGMGSDEHEVRGARGCVDMHDEDDDHDDDRDDDHESDHEDETDHDDEHDGEESDDQDDEDESEDDRREQSMKWWKQLFDWLSRMF